MSLDDPEVRNIIKHEVEQNLDSLKIYAESIDPTHRYLAAKAFASYQNVEALPILDSLLKDPLKRVAAMAAYSIGQIGKEESENTLIEAFKSRDTSSVDNIVNSNILEAIGKLGSRKMLDAMADVSTYRKTDTLLLLGQVRSFYQYSLRGIVSEKATQKAVEYINDADYPQQVRLMAAHYLARSNQVDVNNFKFQLTQALVKEEDVDIKMAIALSLRKTTDPEVQEILLEQLELQQDDRVKMNLIRALSSQDYINGAEKMINLLSDPSLPVASSAADFFIANGNKDDATVYRALAREDRPWLIKSKLYYAVFKNLPYYYTKTLSATRWELIQQVKKEENAYARASFIQALSNDPGAYAEVIKLMEDAEEPAVKTAIVQTLGNIINHPEFDLTFKTSSRYAKRTILTFLQEQLKESDAGITAEIGNILATKESRLIPLIDSTNFLDTAKMNLKLPRDVEGYHAIERAIANLKGVSDPVLTKLDANFTPDFALLEEFKDKPIVIVKTNKGIFNIELMPAEAPISTFNFLKLVKENYFDGVKIHRVVPNFVTQIGCNRGDGYGSLDYSITSEVGPLHYDGEAYVGMASAGLHTESSQWFVTHSPTPHLDGNYSIFGRVIEGMDVILKTEIGDEIQDIIIKQI